MKQYTLENKSDGGDPLAHEGVLWSSRGNSGQLAPCTDAGHCEEGFTKAPL